MKLAYFFRVVAIQFQCSFFFLFFLLCEEGICLPYTSLMVFNVFVFFLPPIN